jgi:hypothetical protein
MENSERSPTASGRQTRRTAGRSEDRKVLEEQLQEGLEGSFPGSDPVSVTTSLISGSPKDKRNNLAGARLDAEKLFDRPILISPRRGESLDIKSAQQAADFLMTGWPGERNQWHRDALDACLKVIEGYRSTADAETAFREAANRAGILLPR